jgi:hypothetical protein
MVLWIYSRFCSSENTVQYRISERLAPVFYAAEGQSNNKKMMRRTHLLGKGRALVNLAGILLALPLKIVRSVPMSLPSQVYVVSLWL